MSFWSMSMVRPAPPSGFDQTSLRGSTRICNIKNPDHVDDHARSVNTCSPSSGAHSGSVPGNDCHHGTVELVERARRDVRPDVGPLPGRGQIGDCARGVWSSEEQNRRHRQTDSWILLAFDQHSAERHRFTRRLLRSRSLLLSAIRSSSMVMR